MKLRDKHIRYKTKLETSEKKQTLSQVCGSSVRPINLEMVCTNKIENFEFDPNAKKNAKPKKNEEPKKKIPINDITFNQCPATPG